jgi:hypothetical protein
MKFHGWIINTVLALVVVVGCILGVRRSRELQMDPHPGTSYLKALTTDISRQISGEAEAPIHVIEKGDRVVVSAEVDDMVAPPQLSLIARELESKGFQTVSLKEGYCASMSKGESVVDINLYQREGSPSRVATIYVAWGMGPGRCNRH